MADSAPSLDELLVRARAGDAAALDGLLAELHAELRSVAQRLMQSEHDGHTLQATAVVHEAWLRLGGEQVLRGVVDEAHLLRLAVRAMRQVLIDHARAKARDKRGGGARRQPLEPLAESLPATATLDLLDLHDALRRFEALDAQAAQVVELRFFGGLSIAEAARALSISTATVERDWRAARLWLARELAGEGEGR